MPIRKSAPRVDVDANVRATAIAPDQTGADRETQSRPLARALGGKECPNRPGGGAKLTDREVDVAQHYGQGIVDLMGDTTDELAGGG